MSAPAPFRRQVHHGPAGLAAAFRLACGLRFASSEIGNPPKRGGVRAFIPIFRFPAA